MMKKCGIIFLLLAAALYSCSPKGAGNSTTSSENSTAAELQPAEMIEIRDTVPLDSYAPNSPATKISIVLEPVTLDNSTATARAINNISYALTGTENNDLTEAAEKYRQKLVAEYEELRADYINIRANNEEPFWFNHEHMLNGRCETGYKGYVNYIMDFFDYTGGAHPNSYKTVLTFDPGNGQETTLDNIMKENYEDTLLPLITQALMKNFNVTTPEELDRYIFSHNELFVSKNVILGKEKITFIYNRYEIAPYAAGEILIDIEYENIKEIMK